ncbi:hypothetical protein KSS87_002181, partial [Heliosperma pusillum]
MSSSVLSSQSMIITTAMAVSGAVILLSLCRIKNLPSIQPNSPSLRSCLSSERLKAENKNKKKKRVKFAESVNDEKSDTNYTKKKKKDEEEVVKSTKVSKFREIMPANRAALYRGILRDRIHRVESSLQTQLRKYVSDLCHVLEADSIEVDEALNYEKVAKKILDREVRKTRGGKTRLVKVLWSNHNVEEAAWEVEGAM